jgi:hypothetical protein
VDVFPHLGSGYFVKQLLDEAERTKKTADPSAQEYGEE